MPPKALFVFIVCRFWLLLSKLNQKVDKTCSMSHLFCLSLQFKSAGVKQAFLLSKKHHLILNTNNSPPMGPGLLRKRDL